MSKVLYILLGLVPLLFRECSGVGLTVTPVPQQLTVRLGETVNLLCTANQRPSVCLWRTPYKSIYTVAGGRTWENGRVGFSPLAGDNHCGLTLRGVTEQDQGVWQCEVGAVEEGEFSTTTAETSIKIIEPGSGVDPEALGLEGQEITLLCGEGVGECSWRTPYDRTYRLLAGEYAERGRIQALGGCSIRVGNLQTRDGGAWTCIRAGQPPVSTQLKLEIALKLSAPTSILQQADQKATLVCHANRQYETCEWETPYKAIVRFNGETSVHEDGRLNYFGFSNMDCGIVIKGLNPGDSGGWTCRVTATVAGKLQISTDIVRLFVEPSQLEESPRRIDDQSGSRQGSPDYHILQYEDSSDEFDYANIDFDKVGTKKENSNDRVNSLAVPEVPTMTTPAQTSVQGPTTSSPGVTHVPRTDSHVPGSSAIVPESTTHIPGSTTHIPGISTAFLFLTTAFPGVNTAIPGIVQSTPGIKNASFNVETTTPLVSRTVEEQDGFIRDIQRVGKFGTVRIDRVKDTQPSTTDGGLESKLDGKEDLTGGLNPSELDFLALLSGSRVDNRPFPLLENETIFGTRHSSSGGSRFQFGNVDLKLAEHHISTQSAKTSVVPQTPPPIIVSQLETTDSTPEQRRLQQMRREQEMLARRREETEARRRDGDEKKRNEEVEARKKELEEKKKKEDQLRKREEEDKKKIVEEDLRRREAEEKKKKEAIEEEEKKRQEEEKKIIDELAAEKRRKEEEEKIHVTMKEEEEKKIVEEAKRKEFKRKEEALRIKEEEEAKKEEEAKQKEEIEAKKLSEENREEEIASRKREEAEVRRRTETTTQIDSMDRPRNINLSRDKGRVRQEGKKLDSSPTSDNSFRDKELSSEEPNRNHGRQRIRGKERTDTGEIQPSEEEETVRRRQEEDQRRERIERLREKQQQEAEKLQAERDRRRQEVQREKNKEEEERMQQEKNRLEEVNSIREKQKKDEVEDQRRQKEERERLEKEKQKEEELSIAKVLAAKAIEEEEKQKKIKEEREKAEKDLEEKKRKEFEEEQQREEEQRVKKLNAERDRIRMNAEEKRKKEEEELSLIRQREEQRKEEISRLKYIQSERDKQLSDEREKLRLEIEQQKKREEEELENIRRREEQRRVELHELRALQEERDRLLKQERERIISDEREKIIQAEKLKLQQEQSNLKRQLEEEQEQARRNMEQEDRHKEIEQLKEQHQQREINLKEEREKIEKEREKLAKEQEELRQQKEQLDKIRQEHATATSRTLPKQNQEEQKVCLISPWPTDGNITCPDSPTNRGNFLVKSGNKCHLECNQGFVSLDARESLCTNGEWSRDLLCVKPGSMMVVGGRSDTYGVLSSVELITSGGICKNAVPSLPAMRWKSVAASLDPNTFVVCGGINLLGDPKTDCWKLNFPPPDYRPEWGKIASLNVPRDAAAWAAEGGKLFVLGGSLGSLSGYTASVEIYDPQLDSWTQGPSLPTNRSSHCAVGLGNGSIIVTGGYGALGTVQRLDIHTGFWTDLPELTPLRAQHGCALVELVGQKGVLVVGGDSGGTRLKDVRFLALGRRAEWRKIADINTARWGRPSVGLIAGKITVVGGWDGVKALSSLEYYEERTDTWVTSRTVRLATERRWAAGAQISNSLFPRCASKRA